MRHTSSASRFGTASASNSSGWGSGWRSSGADGGCSSPNQPPSASRALQSPPAPSTTASRAPGR